MKRLYAVVLGAALVAGCTRDALSPAPAGSFGHRPPSLGDLGAAGSHGGGRRGITVMTRNIYLGADIDPLIAAPPPLVAFVAAETFATIRATDFPARAEALADEIAAADPHLVGLQEVILYRTQTPGDAAFGGVTPATTVFQDFLEILRAALAARGLDYDVAVVQQNTDAEVPVFTGTGPGGLPTFTDVRLTDRDVILVRGDVEYSDPRSANYTVNMPVMIGGRPLLFLRGWTSVVASVGGYTFRFFNTHLETPTGAAFQVAQATELLSIAQAEPLPVLMLGDFNSDAGGTDTPTYGLLTGAGFRDAWLASRPRTAGLTCCHEPDLRNEATAFRMRIDLVLLGARFDTRHGSEFERVRATVVGDEPRDRTPSGLWPSDHAGVVATLKLPAKVAHW